MVAWRSQMGENRSDSIGYKPRVIIKENRFEKHDEKNINIFTVNDEYTPIESTKLDFESISQSTILELVWCVIKVFEEGSFEVIIVKVVDLRPVYVGYNLSE